MLRSLIPLCTLWVACSFAQSSPVDNTAAIACKSESEEVLLHENTTTALPVLGIVPCGAHVTVVAKQPGWYLVRTQDGKQGYVKDVFFSATPPGDFAPGALQRKEIRNPVEYNAYVNAFQQTNPAQKAQTLEAFLQTYSDSVWKEDALELLMAAYQQAGDAQKALDTAERVLQVNPNNARALALLAYHYRAMASQGGPQLQANLAKAQQYGQEGLQALQNMKKPAGMSDADFTKLHNETGAIFEGAVGFAALQAKDYGTADKDLKLAVDWEAQPNVADIYPLAVADLEAEPLNQEGFWFLVKAAMLAGSAGQQQILDYGKKKYILFHGSEQGWKDLVANAKASQGVLPPDNFAVTPSAIAWIKIRVLEEASIPYEQKLGGGPSTSCSISSGPNLHLTCNSYDTTVNWPHVLNVMLVEASDGNAYVIACDRAWAWSKCVPLSSGLTFEARHTANGLAVRGFNAKGKESEPTYAILQSKALRQASLGGH